MLTLVVNGLLEEQLLIRIIQCLHTTLHEYSFIVLGIETEIKYIHFSSQLNFTLSVFYKESFKKIIYCF